MHFIKHFILSFHRFNCNLEHLKKSILRHTPRVSHFWPFFYLITRCDGTRQTKEDTWECHQIRKTLHSIIKRKQFFDNLGDHCHCTTFGRKRYENENESHLTIHSFRNSIYNWSATVMLVTLWCWWLTVGDNYRMWATELRSWWHLWMLVPDANVKR